MGRKRQAADFCRIGSTADSQRPPASETQFRSNRPLPLVCVSARTAFQAGNWAATKLVDVQTAYSWRVQDPIVETLGIGPVSTGEQCVATGFTLKLKENRYSVISSKRLTHQPSLRDGNSFLIGLVHGLKPMATFRRSLHDPRSLHGSRMSSWFLGNSKVTRPLSTIYLGT